MLYFYNILKSLHLMDSLKSLSSQEYNFYLLMFHSYII